MDLFSFTIPMSDDDWDEWQFSEADRDYIDDRSNVEWDDLMADYDPGRITRDEIAGVDGQRRGDDGLLARYSQVFEYFQHHGGDEAGLHEDVLPDPSTTDVKSCPPTCNSDECGTSQQHVQNAPRSNMLGLFFRVCAMCGDQHCSVSQLWSREYPHISWERPILHELRSTEKHSPKTGSFLRKKSPLPDVHKEINCRTNGAGVIRRQTNFASRARWLRLYRSPYSRDCGAEA